MDARVAESPAPAASSGQHYPPVYATRGRWVGGVSYCGTTMPDDPLNALLALDADLHPDPVDVFENFLAARLGLTRHPSFDQAAWRRIRVAFIEAAGERADRLGDELASELLA